MLQIAVPLSRPLTWSLPEYRDTAGSQPAAPVTPTIYTLVRTSAVLLMMVLSTAGRVRGQDPALSRWLSRPVHTL
jgi:hypothetical protein